MTCSDTELSQEELAQRAQRAPGDGLVTVNETYIDTGALGAHPHRVQELDIELEQAEKRLRPLRLGRIERDRAAATRCERKARHILLRPGHFPQDAGGDRTVKVLDDV